MNFDTKKQLIAFRKMPDIWVTRNNINSWTFNSSEVCLTAKNRRYSTKDTLRPAFEKWMKSMGYSPQFASAAFCALHNNLCIVCWSGSIKIVPSRLSVKDIAKS